MLGIQLFSASLVFYGLFACVIFGIAIIVYVTSRSPAKNTTVLDDLVLGERQKNINGYTGTVTVEGEPLDVVTEGNFIKQGNIVRIINVDGSRILVRQI